MKGRHPHIEIATGRVWTKNLGPTLVTLVVGVLIAFIPAFVHFFELWFASYLSIYISFTRTIEEFFLGALAVALSASLNYLESHYECNLGRASGGLATFSLVAGFLSLTGYFFVHFVGYKMFDPTHDSGLAVWASLILMPLTVLVSCLSVLQARRMKDLSVGA